MPIADDNQFPGSGFSLDLVRDLREHLMWLRLNGRADNTLAYRRRAMVMLAEWLGRDPWDATYDELFQWQIVLSGTSLEQVRWMTALIRPYYRWLHNRGVRPDNPAALLPMPELPPGLPRPISEFNLMAAIAAAPPRVLPWLLLAAWCGMRAKEIAGMCHEHITIDERGQAWCRVTGKRGRVRDVPIPSWVYPHIIAASAASGPCWRRVQGFGSSSAKLVSLYCNRHLRDMGIPDTLHALRHRAATEALDAANGDLTVVQDFLGHVNPVTTRVYTRVRPARIAAAVEKLPAPAALALPHPAPRRLLRIVETQEGTTA